MKNINTMEQTEIDVVITWVDSADYEWLNEKKKYNANVDVDDSIARYRDFGTLKYVLRSIEKFAPWVRKIFLVTNGQVPNWLQLENEKVQIIKHSDFMPAEYLPTFSSHPIEWNFHRIKDLSENFIYFNDDVILTDYVQPDDFFKNDLPCDSFVLDVISPKEFFSHIIFNNTLVLNKYFNLKQTIKKNKKKFFNLKYGKKLIRNLILSRLNVFYGIHNHHVAISFKKSSFETLWKKEGEWIDLTCKNRFRNKNDISLWLVRYWQLATGKFVPRSIKFGRFFSIYNFVKNKKMKKWLKNGKFKVVCVNDANIETMDFLEVKEIFESLMNNILGGKSSFEK